MEIFADYILKLVSSIPLFSFYPIVAPVAESVYFAYLIAAITISPKYREKRKNNLSTVGVLSPYCFTAAKVASDAICGVLTLTTAKFAALGLSIASISLFLASTANYLNCKLSVNSPEKSNHSTRIEPQSDCTSPSRIIADNPFKRAEYLPTKKMWSMPHDEELNYGEILSYCNKIKEKSPTPTEIDEISSIENDVKKYSLKVLDDCDRRSLSTKLGFLIKLLAKYGVN